MEFVLASRNRKKIAELETLLRQISSDIKVVSLDDIGFEGEIAETGKTFEENSAIKAGVPAKLGHIGIADDSGLCVDALGGAPGVYSARYSGGGDAANNEKLLSKLRDVPEDKRGARFVSVITLMTPDGEKLTARGECRGRILRERRGDNGFGYDPLFWYEPLHKSFAELTPEEKNEVSHRGRAMRAFAQMLRARLEKGSLT